MTIRVLSRTNHSFALKRDRQFYKRREVVFFDRTLYPYTVLINTGNDNLHDSLTHSEISLSDSIHKNYKAVYYLNNLLAFLYVFPGGFL